MTSICKRSGISAFSLIELLVVILIVAILAALSFPIISNALESARLTKSISNVRQIHMGFMLYVQDNDGVFPSGNHTQKDWWMAPNSGVPEYLYPGRDLTWKKQGTVFESPNAEPDGTFGGRTISYASNGILAGTLPSRKFGFLPYPAQTLLLADASNSHDLWGKLNYRNNGKSVCLFLSGLALPLSPEEVAKLEQRVFWQGRP